MKHTKWLDKKIMCGYCKFACCTNPSFHVDISEEEQKLYKEKYNKTLPLSWSLGKDPSDPEHYCPNLTPNGCELGEDRPAYCKSYPLELDKNHAIKVGTFAWLHCPKPQDYEFSHEENGKYYYKLIEKNYHAFNKQREIDLPEPIDEHFKPVGSNTYEYYENLRFAYERMIPTINLEDYSE